ncbi:helix-turn-helix domain-containing protein [Muricauda sp. TY007]|uniref:helix-turn-helix domain-containing protein n=1 Tax=Allomuricauda sp. TY007 TaxID=2683200 RepID=UPI0013C1CFF9|nr:helix-turn-helix transcriptional regulator [Muricauda sp. TY007]NDV17680.1 helix-turn-helix domain-containing protein [Muricauda sp. TY007]
MSDDELYKLKLGIGAIIKKHREEKGVSQLNMGIDIDMSANQIGRIERAESNPTVETLHTIANYFGFEIIEFFKKQ